MKNPIGRRDFIKGGASAIASASVLAQSHLGLAGGKPPQKSKVVQVTHPKVVTEARKIDSAAVQKMLSEGMTGLIKSKAPWSVLFKPGERVGIKINTLGRPLIVTHHELVLAVASALKDAGINENNIIVWDRFESHMRDAKYVMNKTKTGIQYLASETGQDKAYDVGNAYASSRDNGDRREEKFGDKSPISKIFLEKCDKVINLAVLKDHGLSGVTLCLKNIAFGITGNNARFHGSDHIDPFIADVCALDQVRKKVVLHMIDGLEGCFDGGPLPRDQSVLFQPRTLWLGLDPVALDVVGRAEIEAERRKKGLPPLKAVRRPGTHIELAGKRGLGNAKMKKIKVEKIALKA
ncbi:MAG: DUF362 domain-containing protein [Myxococcota bacterium]|nr:DUF362 domain-containing protein [Myxococcota bacterium]